MLGFCDKLKKIKGIEKFNTIKAENMNSTFCACHELEELDLSNFNNSNVKDTSNVNDMSYMFNQCHNLKEIKGINNFNTIKVNIMKAMFQQYNLLEELDLSNFNT